MVVFGQKLCYHGKSGFIGVTCLYSGKKVDLGKVVVFGQNGCIRAKVGLIRANVVVLGQS